MTKNNLSDEQLWEAVSLEDDAKAFTTLYDRHWLKIHATVAYYLKNTDEAEQALQEIFMTLWDRRKTLQIKSFKNYIFISARYYVFKVLKDRKQDPVIYLEALEYTKGTVENIGHKKMELMHLEHRISAALATLPLRCQEIFRMSRMEHQTNDEIAARLGISKRTVENQLTRALRQLRLSYSEIISDTVLSVLLLWWLIGQ